MKVAALALAILVAGSGALAAASDDAVELPTRGTVADVLRSLAREEGIPTEPVEACPTLAAGLALHAGRLGVATPPAPLGLGAELEGALGCLLGAVHAANLAHDATFGDVAPADLAAAWSLETGAAGLAEGRDHRLILAAAVRLADAVERAIPVLEAARGVPLPPIELEPILLVESLGPTLHVREYAVVIDLAGADVYDTHAGGVFLAKADPGSEFNSVEPDSAWLELRVLDGSDVFVAPKTQDADFVASAGLVIDLDGDDTYGVKRAPRLSDLACPGADRIAWVGTQGAGIAGVGMLYDLAGDDTYLGRTATQGAGHVMGVGVLHDAEGDDRYEAVRMAQGSALLGGVGLLLDSSGNDEYAVLVPEGGVFNGDTRDCDFTGRYAQGSIFDNRLGGGPPMVGLLLERGGDDTYRADAKSQGFGQGIGLALLDEAGGADVYAGGDLSQGAALGRPTVTATPTMAGLAILLDRDGDDTYVAAQRSHGYSSGATLTTPLPEPSLASVIAWAKDREEIAAALVDLDGADRYSTAGRVDGAHAVTGVVGLFADA